MWDLDLLPNNSLLKPKDHTTCGLPSSELILIRQIILYRRYKIAGPAAWPPHYQNDFQHKAQLNTDLQSRGYTKKAFPHKGVHLPNHLALIPLVRLLSSIKRL